MTVPLAEAELLGGLGIPVVKCSNFIGEALDIAATQHFERVILVGHIGNLVKVAGGVMNTHSRYAAFPHLYFPSRPELAERFVQGAKLYRKDRIDHDQT